MKKIIYLNIFLISFFITTIQLSAKNIPNLIGKWQGENIKSSLKKGFVKIQSKKYNYVFSAVAYEFPFFRSFTLSSANGLKMIFNKNVKKRSQDLKRIMCDAGQFYWAYKKTWIRKKIFFTKNSDVVMIPQWRYHDIDTKENWKRAEIYSKYIR